MENIKINKLIKAVEKQEKTIKKLEDTITVIGKDIDRLNSINMVTLPSFDLVTLYRNQINEIFMEYTGNIYADVYYTNPETNKVKNISDDKNYIKRMNKVLKILVRVLKYAPIEVLEILVDNSEFHYIIVHTNRVKILKRMVDKNMNLDLIARTCKASVIKYLIEQRIYSEDKETSRYYKDKMNYYGKNGKNVIGVDKLEVSNITDIAITILKRELGITSYLLGSKIFAKRFMDLFAFHDIHDKSYNIASHLTVDEAVKFMQYYPKDVTVAFVKQLPLFAMYYNNEIYPHVLDNKNLDSYTIRIAMLVKGIDDIMNGRTSIIIYDEDMYRKLFNEGLESLFKLLFDDKINGTIKTKYELLFPAFDINKPIFDQLYPDDIVELFRNAPRTVSSTVAIVG